MIQMPKAVFGVRAGAVEAYHVIGGELIVHIGSVPQKAGWVKVLWGVTWVSQNKTRTSFRCRIPLIITRARTK